MTSVEYEDAADAALLRVPEPPQITRAIFSLHDHRCRLVQRLHSQLSFCLVLKGDGEAPASRFPSTVIRFLQLNNLVRRGELPSEVVLYRNDWN